MRNRRNVPNKSNLDPRRLNSTHCRLAAGPRTFHPHLASIHTELARRLSGANTGLLRCEWSALPRPVEAKRAGRRLADQVTFQIRDRHQCVVEARLNVNDSLRHQSPLFALERLFLAGFCLSFCHNPRDVVMLKRRPFGHGSRFTDHFLLLPCRLLLGYGHATRPLAGARIRVCPLTSNRKPSAVTQAAVAADVHHPLDVHLDLLA